MKKIPGKRTALKIKEQKPVKYETDYRFTERGLTSPKDVRTTTELIAFLESPAGKNVEVEARLIAHKEGEGFGVRKLNRKGFLESYRANNDGRKRFKEAYDDFSRGGIGGGFANTVGQDFTPLLGGPFYKQLYYYNDWLKMHQDCFFAMNHDPLGKATVNIITNFVLGKGFRVEFDNKVAQALWDAFEEANGFQEMMRQFCRELSGYGENMLWKLPNKERYIIFPKNEMTLADVPKVIIPRIRLVDPSNINEIITYPEDITRVLFYVWVAPTQYQTYTAKDDKTGKLVNGTKFIYQQIPADQILHYKVNSVSNEKRGRSDLFAALPYFKRLRDAVNYEIIAQQKNAAWAIDTTIEGDDADVSAYMQAMQDLGSVPNAGSEFVHTKAITREYLGNSSAAKGVSSAFEWCLSMVSGCTGIPIPYYGTHLSGGQTRASAIVSTEPVAKMFEMRQLIVKSAISDVAKWVLKEFGIDSPFEITMPEIITQDRSQKLKDIYLGEQAKWWSPERAAETAAGEMGFRDYDYETEQEKIRDQQAEEPTGLLNPLSAGGLKLTDPATDGAKPSAMDGQDKKAVKDKR